MRGEGEKHPGFFLLQSRGLLPTFSEERKGVVVLSSAFAVFFPRRSQNGSIPQPGNASFCCCLLFLCILIRRELLLLCLLYEKILVNYLFETLFG